MKNAQDYAERIEAGTRSFVSDVRKTSAQNDLFRSTTNKYIGGVCGGLAERYKIDPTLVRLIFIALSFTGSVGVWVYIALWIFLPSDVDVAGELDAYVADVPPMPKSGPYVDVPGMDPVGTKPSKAASAPAAPPAAEPGASANSPEGTANVTDAGNTDTGNEDFPKPNTTL